MERNYIGVDLHKAFFQVCAVSGTGAREWEARFPRTAEGIGDVRRRCTAGSQVAVEASGPTWSFVDAIEPSGATIVVVDPRKTKLKAGCAAKTDRLDARRLADAVCRDSVVSISVPPPEIRALRDLCRGRHQLVRLRTRTAQMIRALLLRTGLADVPVRRVYSAKGLDWLAALEVPAEETAATLEHVRHVLEAIQIEASAAETAVRQRAGADAIAVALDALVGIGPILAFTIRAEVADITRFATGAAVASYAGLVSCVFPCGRMLPAHAIRSPVVRRVLGDAIAALENLDQHQAGKEPAEMCPERDAACLLSNDAGNAAGELQERPVDQHHPRRQRHRGNEEPERHEREHAHVRKQHEIRAHHTADRS